MNQALNETEVKQCIGGVREPQIGRSLADLRMIKNVRGDAGSLTVELELPTPAYPGQPQLAQAVRSAIRGRFPQAPEPDVNFTWKVRGKDSGGSLGLHVRNVVAVGSGKGGVGKSTVAASIAYGLQHFGAKVGLMDADVYGPSIPHMLGVHERPALTQIPGPEGKPINRIQPIIADGLPVMSMGLFVKPDEAVVWRGPMLHGAITQFLKDTDWGELDYLIIDLPPGTGDVTLTLSQLLGLAGAVVVCTPQDVALLDAVKALKMFEKVKIPVLGVVENMSHFECPHCHERTDIFGHGGAAKKAAELGVPFLGEIPINLQTRINCDAGQLRDNFAADSVVRPYLLHIVEQTALQIAKSLLEAPRMPTLEIL